MAAHRDWIGRAVQDLYTNAIGMDSAGIDIVTMRLAIQQNWFEVELPLALLCGV